MMPARKNRPGGKNTGRDTTQQGFALVVVIVVLLLCSFLASDLLLQARTETKIAGNIKDRITERFLAEAGVNLGIFRIMEGQSSVVVPADPEAQPETESTETAPPGEELGERLREGFPYRQQIGEHGRVTYSIISETGKIDLNNAPREFLALFFEYYGLDADQSETIIDSLLDWRDSDDYNRLKGAEKSTYEALPEPYIPRNGAIQDPAEFFLVNGTAPLAGKFNASEVFTVHNSQHTINVNSLTATMLNFVTEGDGEKATTYREAQKMYGTLTEVHFRQIIGEERYSRLQPYLSFTTSFSNHYSVVAVGQTVYIQDDKDQVDNDEEIIGSTVNVLIEKQGANYTILAREERGA